LGAVVQVPTLARVESVALLSGRVPDMDADTADRIADLLGDLALAVEQAAGFCEQTGTPAAEFAGLLADRLDEVIEFGEVVGRAGVTVATLWELSVSRLAVAEPAAVELLELLAFCGPEPVPLDLLVDRSELLGEGALSQVVVDRLAWTRTVGALVGYGLASRDTRTVVVHRLIQATTRRRTSEARRSAVLAVLLRLLRADLPGDIVRSPQGWPRWRDRLPHVRTVVGQMPDPDSAPSTSEADVPNDVDDLVWLCDRAATYLQEHGRAGEALPLFQRALTIDEAVYGPDHPEVSTDLNNLALALQDLGRAGEALPLFQRALTIDEAVYGPDHPEVSTDLNNLASALQDLGRAGEALPLFQRALTIDEAVYGPDHPEVSTRLNNLALALQDLGRAGEALPLFQRALTIDEAVYGPDHPTVSTRLNNLASALQDLGRAGEALPLFQRALTIAEAVYGPDHPSVTTIRGNLEAARNSLDG
ncbi:tetratricopeptide repeat protein, partial [Frankia tisae]|uniref:tetratricopeptide repeat protein n=1 Tax=Frankia tisae TaxID=2950104 RepID=UPI0021C22E50